MITTIDNSERVFQVVGSDNTQIFCNIEELNRVIKQSFYKEGYFIVYEFWNSKPRKMTSKALKEMFETNGVEQQFKY